MRTKAEKHWMGKRTVAMARWLLIVNGRPLRGENIPKDDCSDWNDSKKKGTSTLERARDFRLFFLSAPFERSFARQPEFWKLFVAIRYLCPSLSLSLAHELHSQHFNRRRQHVSHSICMLGRLQSTYTFRIISAERILLENWVFPFLFRFFSRVNNIFLRQELTLLWVSSSVRISETRALAPRQ